MTKTDMAKARLDMGHGFMKSIIRNQVDRDNYEKECQAKALHPHKMTGNAKQKKPELQTYIPPGIRKDDGESKNLLFRLDYEDENQKVFSFNVYVNDDPVLVAKRVRHDHNLSQPLTRALSDLIRKEIEKRQTT